MIEGRLTHSLPLTRPEAPPVYVARVSATPFCESLDLDCRHDKTAYKSPHCAATGGAA